MTWLKKPNTVAIASEPNEQLATPQERSTPQQLTQATESDETQVQSNNRSFVSKPLISNVKVRYCQKDDINPLKRLISLLIPIAYPENFYREIFNDPSKTHITLLAFWNDNPGSQSAAVRLIGAIICRVLPDSETVGNDNDLAPMLYISALAVLSPYRGHGVAMHLLEVTTKRAVTEYNITSVGAHVWEANEDALGWYRRRGFREVSHEPTYYRRLEPQGAVVVRCDVTNMEKNEDVG